MQSIHIVLQYSLLLIIVLLTLKTVSIVSASRTSKGFVLKKYLQTEQDNTVSTAFLERMFSFSKYKAHTEKLLEEAHMETTFSQFMIKRIVLSIIFALTGIAMSLIIGVTLYMYLAIPLGIMAFMMPKRHLKKAKAAYENQLKLELPEYLSAFAILLQTYSPYEATKASIQYAGPYTKAHVEELVSQLELYPVSPKPYDDFAKRIGLREAKEFMVALQQIMKVSSQDAEQIIKDQTQIMAQMQDEAYNEQIETRPDEVEKYNMLMLLPLIVVIMTFLFVLIADSFSNLG